MENGQLNHLIQNPESANPAQLDSLIELYPAVSILKVLKLKSVYETTGIIDQDLWDQLLIEWPDKKSLLRLKSAGFDPKKIKETAVLEQDSVSEHTPEIENFHITDHQGFIYELPLDLNLIDENQLPSQEIIQNYSNESLQQNIDLDFVSTDPAFEVVDYLPHLGFVYEYSPNLAELIVEITPILNDIPLIDNDPNEETIAPDPELPIIKSIDQLQPKEVDNSLSAYVLWLKSLNQKQSLNISDYEHKKKMKKKSKSEKAVKDKDDRIDRTKTAKKLLKNSKKMQKELAKKQEKTKKKTKKKNELSTIIEGSLKKSPTVNTETYADLLAKQGYFEQLIEMYEKLSLLNPEKSTYFAAKILKLKNN